jgi:hypothetical protein
MVSLGNGFWKGEMVFAMHIEMLETQRSQSFYILWSNLLSESTSLVQRILHIPGIPEHNDVYDEAQRSQLILLPLTIPLTKLASLTMKDMAGDTVSPLSTIQFVC